MVFCAQSTSMVISGQENKRKKRKGKKVPKKLNMKLAKKEKGE